MDKMNVASTIESVLFWKAEPISIGRLAEIIQVNEEEVLKGISELEILLRDRGVTLIRKDNSVALATAPSNAPFIEKLTKDELSKDIGKAGMETLAIVLYYGPISRREIDYIRGVNSAFIVRHLLVRGLVEKVEDKKDQRVFLYKPTFDLLAFLGTKKVEDLPEFDSIRSEFSSFVEQRDKPKDEHDKEQDRPQDNAVNLAP